MKYDYIVIGAGVTGLTLCQKLKLKGYSVRAIEKNSEAGGLCRTKNVDGHTLDIGGGHFFNTKIEEVAEFVFSLISKDKFNYFNPRVSKIKIGETTIDYPLESNIWQLPTEEAIKYIISIIRNGESCGRPQPHTYEEWIRWKLGDKVCDEYMLPYNRKLWGVDPSEMDVDWLHKIPRVNVDEVLLYCLNKQQDTGKYPAHQCFYYPRRGGFQAIVDALYSPVKDEVILSEKVESLSFNGSTWSVNRKWEASNVINTVPWCDLFTALGSPAELKSDFEKIKYNRIEISLYKKEISHDWHWRYIPDEKINHHREFYIHNFAEDSKPNGVYLETNVKRYSSNSNDYDGTFIYSTTTDAAYPIPVIGHKQAITNILNHYAPIGLHGIGRWGQHQYQNADVSIGEAIKFVNRLGYKQ